MTTTLTTLALAPALPWPLIAVLAAAGAALLLVGAVRQARGTAYRGLAVTVALLALLGPTVVEEEREPLPDVAVVVVDESLSQGIGDRSAEAAAALAALEERLEALPNLEVRVVHAGRRETGLQGTSSSETRLFETLRRSLADVPNQQIAGAILITDGQVHDVPADPAALGFDAPVHVLLTGRPGESDRRLVVETLPRYGIVGQPLTLTLHVEDSGAGMEGRPVRVTIRRDGEPVDVELVPVGESQTVSFTLDHAGPTVLEIEAESRPGELGLANNHAVVEVNGVRDRLRVLLVSGEAHAGERVWRNLLKADPSVDLVHFTVLRPPEKQDGTPTRELALISFPVRELFQQRLMDFDLLIFDRYRQRGVIPTRYIEHITYYLDKGGALLVAAGPAFASPLSLYRTPLGSVLPGRPTGEVFEGGYRARLTDVGRRHPVTADLPGAMDDPPRWGRWFRQIYAQAEQGRVLMTGVEDRPILVLDRVGSGRVAQVLTDHMWLWARGFEGGGPQAELLRRLAHWLMKEPDLEEEDLSAEAAGDRIKIVRRSLGAAPATVTVTAPSGAVQSVDLEPGRGGRAWTTVTVEEPGLYRVRDGSHVALAAVGELDSPEFADLRATAARLAPLAAATGGAVAWLFDDDVPGVRRVRPGRDVRGRGWIGLRANERYVVTGVAEAPLLPALLVLTLVLGGLMLAWRAEGR
ncbi:MAG: hypothetical protein ACE5LL_04315 [Alphaproteobacteria bacterium]